MTRAALVTLACAALSLQGCAVLGLRVPCDSDAACPSEQPVCVAGVCAVTAAEGEGEGEGEGEPLACGVEIPAELAPSVVAVVTAAPPDPLPMGCFGTIADAVAAAATSGGTVFVGPGGFREAWPVTLAAGLTLAGAGIDRTVLDIDTVASALVTQAGTTVRDLQIVRTAAQNNLPLVDVHGEASLVALELRGSQTLLATSGDGLYLQDVIFNGGIVGSLIANAERSVIMQHCTIEAGQLILDGSGTHTIRDTTFRFTGDDELRTIGTPDVTLERVHVEASGTVHHVASFDGGRVTVRGTTFAATGVTAALVLAGGGLTRLDLDSASLEIANTFTAPNGRADLQVDMPSGLATAVGNTWSHDPARCGYEVRTGSATTIPVQLDDGPCGATVELCNLEVPTYREVPFVAAVVPIPAGEGCFDTLDAALDSLDGQHDVGVFVASGPHDQNATTLDVSGLLLEGEAGAVFQAQQATLFTATRPAILRRLTLSGAGTYGDPLLVVGAPVVIDICDLTTDGTAISIPSGDATSFEVTGNRIAAAGASGLAIAAALDAGDTVNLVGNTVTAGGIAITGEGAALLDDNELVARDTWRNVLATTGAVTVVNNDVVVVDGAPCREALLLQAGDVTLRDNLFDADEPATSCTGLAIQDEGPLTVDLGTEGDEGGNTFFGVPFVFIDVSTEANRQVIPAFGNVWGDGTAMICGTAVEFAATSRTMTVEFDDGTCSGP